MTFGRKKKLFLTFTVSRIIWSLLHTTLLQKPLCQGNSDGQFGHTITTLHLKCLNELSDIKQDLSYFGYNEIFYNEYTCTLTIVHLH